MTSYTRRRIIYKTSGAGICEIKIGILIFKRCLNIYFYPSDLEVPGMFLLNLIFLLYAGHRGLCGIRKLKWRPETMAPRAIFFRLWTFFLWPRPMLILG
jgi:hypothetical protein